MNTNIKLQLSAMIILADAIHDGLEAEYLSLENAINEGDQTTFTSIELYSAAEVFEDFTLISSALSQFKQSNADFIES